MSNIPRVHFIGVCGKAMGPIAVALARAGWRVTGSDGETYPPMGDYLVENGIAIWPPIVDAAVLAEIPLFVVGKRVTEDNPELAWILQNGRRHLSFPAFLREYFLCHSRNAVITGGVGKTTTTAMLTWILESAGLQPDYLVGGMSHNLPHPARFSGSEVAVLEGDEYASCFDDPRPKFQHYNASIGIVTNLLQDHPDLFTGPDAMLEVFAGWARTLPPEGCLILPDDDPGAHRLTEVAVCRIETVGFSGSATQPITNLQLGPEGARFSLGQQAVFLPVCGRMNVRNAAAAFVAARELGVAPEICARALGDWRGVMNRQEDLTIGTCSIVFDKASHPASLRELFQAMRQRFPGRRVISLIQPRATGGRQWIYQRDLPENLALADHVVIAKPYEHKPRPGQSWPGGPFSLSQLQEDLAQRQVPVHVMEDATQPAAVLQEVLRPDDVLLVTLPEQAMTARAAIIAALHEVAAR